MTAEYIAKCADACAKVYKTRDPEAIFRHRGAKIKNVLPEGLRGMICIFDGECVVYVRDTESDGAKKVEFGKLLGHAMLHRDELLAGGSFEDVDVPTTETAYDREAAIFAAELIIEDAKIRELECFGYTEGQISASLGSLRELAPFKLFSLACRRGGNPSSTLVKSDVELFLKSEV